MRTAIESLPTPPFGVKYIPLTKGKFAIVDEEDYEWIMQWRWYFSDGYAKRNAPRERSKPRAPLISMHRVVNKTPDGLHTDHKNENKLDNRKLNLRNATKGQNGHNRGAISTNKSGFKGVSWSKQHGKWVSKIMFQWKSIHIGLFDDPKEAHNAYILASRKLHGEFAKEC